MPLQGSVSAFTGCGSATHLRPSLPPERLFWSTADASLLGRDRRARATTSPRSAGPAARAFRRGARSRRWRRRRSHHGFMITVFISAPGTSRRRTKRLQCGRKRRMMPPRPRNRIGRGRYSPRRTRISSTTRCSRLSPVSGRVAAARAVSNVCGEQWTWSIGEKVTGRAHSPVPMPHGPDGTMAIPPCLPSEADVKGARAP